MSPLGLLFLLLLLPLLSTAAITDLTYYSCNGGNYIASSTFESNLKQLLTSLSVSSTNSTFSKATKGSTPNYAYGLFLCRGDISPIECHSCVQTATQDVSQLCSTSKQVTVWYEGCQIRYSDSTFFSFIDQNYKIYDNEPNDTDPDTFSKYERELMINISYQAAYNYSNMFATGELAYRSDKRSIYGLVQCTRDLSNDTCYQCLEQILDFHWKCCSAQQEGRVLMNSCNFRYENYKFFEGEPIISLALQPSPAPFPSPPPSTSTGKANGKGNRNIIIISIVISIVIVFLVIFAVRIFFRMRSAQNSHGTANPGEISSTESLYFDLSVLKVATANFSDVNKLGQGGFGAVYKGTLPHGEDIAVKRLSASSRQGIEELKNELLLVAKLQHRNLVRLRGVCLEEGEKLLVYEYMPNGSLDKVLFGNSSAE